ncbi:hypothetical protein BH23PLA1_BH23PLA1_37140 [soil metagenome]
MTRFLVRCADWGLDRLRSTDQDEIRSTTTGSIRSRSAGIRIVRPSIATRPGRSPCPTRWVAPAIVLFLAIGASTSASAVGATSQRPGAHNCCCGPVCAGDCCCLPLTPPPVPNRRSVAESSTEESDLEAEGLSPCLDYIPCGSGPGVPPSLSSTRDRPPALATRFLPVGLDPTRCNWQWDSARLAKPLPDDLPEEPPRTHRAC